jgi:hypothetical protein
MKVQIFSLMAAVVGGEHGAQWEGEVFIENEDALSPEEINEQIFRLFNRVEDADGVRLERMGYRLPSLSVGDFVTWGGKTYSPGMIGWNCVTGNDNDAARYILQAHFNDTD